MRDEVFISVREFLSIFIKNNLKMQENLEARMFYIQYLYRAESL